MKADEEIAEDYWRRWSEANPPRHALVPNDNDIGLVRAGRIAELRWVLDHNIESGLRKIIDAKLAELEDKP